MSSNFIREGRDMLSSNSNDSREETTASQKEIPSAAEIGLDGGLTDPLERLIETVVDKEQSIEETIQLLQMLRDKGFLRNISYFVSDFEDLLDAAVKLATSPSMLALFAMKGELKDAFKEIDVQKLPQWTHRLTAMTHGMDHPDETVRVDGVLDLFRLMRDKDVKVALTSIFGGLKALGQSIEETQGQTQT